MSDVVFILGAGASADCGAPVMNNFLDVALRLQLTDAVKDKERESKTVFRTIGKLQSVHSKAQLDLTNIESIFTALELAKTIKAPILNEQETTDAIAALKALIVRTLEETILFPKSNRGETLSTDSYGSFALLVNALGHVATPPHKVSTITFNYDIALDIALHRRQLGPDYAIEVKEQMPGRIRLMKLHGSLNWATEKGTNTIRPLGVGGFVAGENVLPDAIGNRIPIGRLLKPHFNREGIDVDDGPLIVPPTWNKADHYSMLSNVWAAAAAHLSKARYIIVLGYSLPETDSFFRHLYALGSVGDDPLLAFRVYDRLPKQSAVDERFAKLLGPGAQSRYEYVSKSFKEAIADIRIFFGLPPESPARSPRDAL